VESLSSLKLRQVVGQEPDLWWLARWVEKEARERAIHPYQQKVNYINELSGVAAFIISTVGQQAKMKTFLW